MKYYFIVYIEGKATANDVIDKHPYKFLKEHPTAALLYYKKISKKDYELFLRSVGE